MVKKLKAEIKSFSKGLITEASFLNFPPDASTDERNFTLTSKGNRERRLGLDFEYNATYRTSAFGDSLTRSDLISSFEWYNAGGLPGRSIIVMQYNTTLDFFTATAVPLSSGYLGSVSLASMGSSGNKHSIACVDGRLVVAAGVDSIAVVTYNGSTFSTEFVKLRTRDVWGVEYFPTDNDPTLRPISIGNDIPRYNLYNQGWGIPRKAGITGTVYDPIALFNTVVGRYPSNSDSIWTSVQYSPPTTSLAAKEEMYANLYTENTGTSGPVAKGYFIIDLLDRSTSRAANVVTNYGKYPDCALSTFAAPTDKTSGGATVVAEYAGRIFYSGFNGVLVGGDKRSPILSNYVFFSQLVKSSPDLVNCYQSGDPTSRESSDLVDTDGGFIRITGADKILRLMNVSEGLLVIANNGVWVISGGAEYGFTATNYKVDKITSFGCISSRSVVEDSGMAYMWSQDGIYVIARNQTGKWVAENMTKQTIHQFYFDLPMAYKKDAFGYYDPKGRKVRWICSTSDLFQTNSSQIELVFDMVFKAFTVNEIGASKVGIFGMVKDTDLNIKYLSVAKILGVYNYSFAEYWNTVFSDWYALDGVGTDAKAYITSGPITADDSSVNKQVPYLTVHLTKTEEADAFGVPIKESSCLARSQWNWADNGNGNKWGPLFQCYRFRNPYLATGDIFEDGQTVVTSKNKLRGRGKAVSIHFETEAHKDCRIIGWNLNVVSGENT